MWNSLLEPYLSHGQLQGTRTALRAGEAATVSVVRVKPSRDRRDPELQNRRVRPQNDC